MAVTFPNIPRWLWRKPAPKQPSTASPAAPYEADNVQYPARKPTSSHKSSTSSNDQSLQSARRSGGRRRLQHRREKRRLDLEFDVVLVPSDGGCCLSGSDSEDSDWSVGWFEPHAPGFCSDDESENSFAVLVPCYGSPSPESSPHEVNKSQLWPAVLSNITNKKSSTGICEQWLSSLQR